MSSVCVLTPIIVSSWPAIAAAAAGVAASMGFAVALPEEIGARQEARPKRRVETELPNSEVLEEQIEHGERLVLSQGDVSIEVGRDARGAVTLCVIGESRSKAELEQIGKEVAGRIVQQFAYHKLVTELKARNYDVVEETVRKDQSIQMRVRVGG